MGDRLERQVFIYKYKVLILRCPTGPSYRLYIYLYSAQLFLVVDQKGYGTVGMGVKFAGLQTHSLSIPLSLL